MLKRSISCFIIWVNYYLGGIMSSNFFSDIWTIVGDSRYLSKAQSDWYMNTIIVKISRNSSIILTIFMFYQCQPLFLFKRHSYQFQKCYLLFFPSCCQAYSIPNNSEIVNKTNQDDLIIVDNIIISLSNWNSLSVYTYW